MKRKTELLIACILVVTMIILSTSNISASAQIDQDIIVTKMEWSPDATQIAYGMSNGVISIWDVAQNTEIMHLTGHSDRITVLNWKQNGEQLTSGSLDGTVRLWDMPSGSNVYTLSNYQDFITQVLWLDNESKIGVFYFANYAFASIHDAETGEEIGRAEGIGTPLAAQYNSLDDVYAISGYDGNVWLVSALDLSVVSQFSTPAELSKNIQVSWSEDFMLLAVADENGDISVRDVGQDTWLHTFRLSDQSDVDVRTLAFDGDRLLGVGADGILRSWDVQTGKVLVDERLGEAISNATFNVETMQLAVAGSNMRLTEPNTTDGIDAQDTSPISVSANVQILDLSEYLDIETQD